MDYRRYADEQSVIDDVDYTLMFPDALVNEHLGLRRSSFVRWLDDDTDLVAIMYGGLKDVGRHYLLDRMLFVTEGHGRRCDEPTALAPVGQHGEVEFADGRRGSWGIGLSDRGWDPSGPPWVSWTCKDGSATYRVQARNMSLDGCGNPWATVGQTWIYEFEA